MDTKGVLISKLNKMISLLEEDEKMIERGLDGEILENYRRLIRLEKANMLETLRKVKLMN